MPLRLCLSALLLLSPVLLYSQSVQPLPGLSPEPATGPQGMAAAVRSLLSTDAAAAQAHWGISMIDAATGQPLYTLNDAQFFEPASNAKLFTASTALALLGPAYTMTTQVLAEGTIDAAGTLHGDLRLVGGGDPTISGRVYPYAGRTERTETPLAGINALAAAIAAHGIRAVTGPVIGDDRLFADDPYGHGWAWDDLQWEYGAPVSALTVNDNVRYLTVTPGAVAGAPLTAAWMPDLPGLPSGLEMDGSTTAPGTPRALGIARLPLSPRLRMYGSLPAGGPPLHVALSLPDPALFAAQALAAALTADGVQVHGGAAVAHRFADDTESFAEETHLPAALRTLPTGSTSLGPPPVGASLEASRVSVPLAQIVTVTLKVSQNLHAEILLRLLGHAEGSDGTAAQGARVVRTLVTTQAGVAPGDFLLYDGSGLSGDDLVTPRSLTALLRWSTTQPWGPVLRQALPVSGVDGTLADRLQALRSRVQAKTGTLSEVVALSGFLTADSGRQVIFSILCNDHPGPDATHTIDAIVEQAARSF